MIFVIYDLHDLYGLGFWVPYTSLARLAPDCQIEKAAYFQSGAIRSSRQDIRFPSISNLAKSGWPSSSVALAAVTPEMASVPSISMAEVVLS